MRTIALSLMLALAAFSAHAVIGTIDPVPAATLLLPHFLVNLDDISGVTTLFSIVNLSSSAAIAHVTLWTDFGIPTLAFDLSLGAFDTQAFNVRDIFNGYGPDGLDLSSESQRIAEAHTGQQDSDSGLCSGLNYGENVARGYITVDVVNTTSALFPSDAGYFVNGGLGVASNANILWGDFYFVDPQNNFAWGDLMVAIEASDSDPLTSLLGMYTFYQRFVGASAEDNREPLGAVWSVSYNTGGEESAGTSLVYWRDPKKPMNPFNCAFGYPDPFPLGHDQATAYSDSGVADPITVQENAAIMPLASGMAPVNGFGLGGGEVQTDFARGHLTLNLNTTIASDNFPGIAQSYVLTSTVSEGRFAGMRAGTVLTHVSGP